MQTIQRDATTVAGARRAIRAIDIVGGIKNLTHDFVNLDKISTSPLSEAARLDRERQLAIDSIMKRLEEGVNKRLLVIVDELDRCKPSYAVNLLELIKHHFNNGDLVFLIPTNIDQLTCTIRAYYGDGFDAGGYLGRMFDATIGLHSISREKYIDTCLDDHVEVWFTKYIVDHYDMSMREIEHNFSSLKVIENYIDNSTDYGEYLFCAFYKYVFCQLP